MGIGTWTLALASFIVIISLSYNSEIYGERIITVEKTLDIEKDKLQKTLIDLENYEKIFPEYVKSAEIIDVNENKTTARLEIGAGFIPISIDAEIEKLDNGENEIRIISGDLRGSTINTKLEKTWSYNGIPNKGTIVEVDLSLKVSGFLALMGLITDDLIKYSIDKSLLSFVDYTNDDVKKIQNQIKHKNRSR